MLQYEEFGHYEASQKHAANIRLLSNITKLFSPRSMKISC